MQFRFGSIPVRAHASFFVMALVLGAMGATDPARIALWVAIVTVSIFAHELGHALMGRTFGLTPMVDLYAMGGLTSFAPSAPLSNGRRVLISLAGPAVGIVVTILVFIASFAGLLPAVDFRGNVLTPDGSVASAATQILIWVNGYWSLFNLLPMLPLDGGNVTLHTLNAVTQGRGERIARLVSLMVAVGVAVLALAYSQIWIVILCASFAVQNGRTLARSTRGAERDEPLRQVLAKAMGDLNGGNARAAISAAEMVAGAAQSAELKIEALRILAYALVADGRWSQLLQLLEGGLARAMADDDLGRFEAAARDSGSREVADSISAVRTQRATATASGPVHFNAG